LTASSTLIKVCIWPFIVGSFLIKYLIIRIKYRF
jgi:hypothetical protein